MPLADWYDDPTDPRWMRFWDGRQWTEFVELRTDWPAAHPPPPRGVVTFAEPADPVAPSSDLIFDEPT